MFDFCNLSPRGYTVVKEKLTSNQIQEIRKDLTVKPFVNTDFGAQSQPFAVYGESARKLYIPRFYGIAKFGDPYISKLDAPEEVDVSFTKELRPIQRPIVDTYMAEATKKSTGGGGIISVPCGYGKTVLALNIMAQLGVKTLIVVHAEFLMNQWKERIEQFVSGAKLGKIQGKVVKTKDKNIVIGMLQTLCKKDFPEDTFKGFGLVIYDECHHLGAEVFSKALLKTNFKYLLGLSATPKRTDGLSKVFEWYLGPMVYVIKKRSEETVDVKVIKYKNNDEAYSKERFNQMGKPMMSTMINNITQFEPRTEIIINEIKTNIEEGRKILLLSDRRDHLREIKDKLDATEITSGFYLGGMKPRDLQETEECQVILGTFSMASEGFDCKYPLHSIILASPKTSIEQAVGRILRQEASKREKTPRIIDIHDSFSLFTNQCRKRMDFYKKNKYNIMIYNEKVELIESHPNPGNPPSSEGSSSSFVDDDD